MFLLAAPGPCDFGTLRQQRRNGRIRHAPSPGHAKNCSDRVIASGTRAVRAKRAGPDIVLPQPHFARADAGLLSLRVCGLTFPAKLRILGKWENQRFSGEGPRLGKGRTYRFDSSAGGLGPLRAAGCGRHCHGVRLRGRARPLRRRSRCPVVSRLAHQDDDGLHRVHRHPRQAGDEGHEDLHLAHRQQTAADAPRPQDRQGHNPQPGVAGAHHALGQRRRRRHRRDAGRR